MVECGFCQFNTKDENKKCYAKDAVCKNYKASKAVIEAVKKAMKEEE